MKKCIFPTLVSFLGLIMKKWTAARIAAVDEVARNIIFSPQAADGVVQAQLKVQYEDTENQDQRTREYATADFVKMHANNKRPTREICSTILQDCSKVWPHRRTHLTR